MDFLTAVFISPPAATWSRLRNSQVPGQVPLRSRQCPLWMMSLSPESQSKVRASNFSLEVYSWFAEQILTSPQLQTFFLLVFPEDFGGDSCTGPASPWSAREFTDLSDAVEAQRGAVYLCRLASAEYRRSVGLLTNVQALSADMYLGWPAFNTQDSTLQYCGPLPSTCACSTMHPSLRGLATQGGFRSFLAQSLGPQFWARILSRMQESQLHCSLRDGVQSSTAGIISHGGFPGYGFALADSLDSVAALHREWKANTLARSLLRDFSASRLDTFFESRGLARDAVLLFSLLSPACKFLDSGRAARAGSGFPVMSSCASPAPLSVRSPSLRGDDHVPGVSTHLGNSSHHSSSSGATGLQPVLSGGAALDGEKSFEHSPPPGDGKVWIHTSQPDESERLSDQAHLQGIPRGTASVDVEHAPSPGFSSSTSKRKFPRELDERAGRRCTILDPVGELASERGIGLSSTSSQTRQSLQSPPVRGRPGGSDGNGRPSLPAACPVTSDFSSQDR